MIEVNLLSINVGYDLRSHRTTVCLPRGEVMVKYHPFRGDCVNVAESRGSGWEVRRDLRLAGYIVQPADGGGE